MSSASKILKEANTQHHALKEQLQTHEPWTKELEAERKEIRRLYLQLLFEYPTSREAKDAETHLWMQTSYAFISSYRQRITDLSQVVYPEDQNSPSSSGRNHGSGPVEYRKLLQRFRQFLAEEEKFWSNLIVRFRRSYVLDDVQPALIALDLAPTDNIARTSTTFSEEDHDLTFPPKTPEEHQIRISVVYKALVWLGDTARYKELYNESGGRPRAGREDGPPAAPPKRGRHRRGGSNSHIVTRDRNYERAQRCYEQARLLMPTDGNASSQLAILASYKRDNFTALLQYYRALCVRSPWEPAAQNLQQLLRKGLQMWNAQKGHKQESNDDSTPKARVDSLKENVVILHALWRLDNRHPDSISKRGQQVVKAFQSLVAERHLPIVTVSDVVILAYGAYWRQRSVRDNPPQSGERNIQPQGFDSELVILTHILALHRALWKVGVLQIAEGVRENHEDQDLAQKITAVFRRILPAIRLTLKWTKANLSHLLQYHAVSLSSSSQGSQDNDFETSLRDSWHALVSFAQVLGEAFPLSSLPTLETPLDEDMDMQGFLPLRKSLSSHHEDVSTKHTSNGPPRSEITSLKDVHPNVEQLMRISDILRDVSDIATFEASPVVKTEHGFIFNYKAEKSPPYATQVHSDKILQGASDGEKGLLESKSVGDVLRPAPLNVNIQDEDEDDEDEIVWDVGVPNARQEEEPVVPLHGPSSSSRNVAPVMTPNSTTPFKQLAEPLKIATHVPISPSEPTGTTAQDLLNRFMFTRPRSRQVSMNMTAPQLPFGTNVAEASQSIWSARRDEPRALAGVPLSTSLSMSPQRTYAPQSPWGPGPRLSQEPTTHQLAHGSVGTGVVLPPPPISTTFSNSQGYSNLGEPTSPYRAGLGSPQHPSLAHISHNTTTLNHESIGSGLSPSYSSIERPAFSPTSPVSPFRTLGPSLAAHLPGGYSDHRRRVSSGAQPPGQSYSQNWMNAR